MQAYVNILISNKIVNKANLTKKERERNYILIHEKIHQEDISVPLNNQVSNTRTKTFAKEALKQLKSHLNPHTLILGDFNTLLSQLDMSSRQNLSMYMLELVYVINQMNLKDIYRTFHLNTKEYTLFSTPQRSFSKIDYILGHKPSLNRYLKIAVTPYILSDQYE